MCDLNVGLFKQLLLFDGRIKSEATDGGKFPFKPSYRLNIDINRSLDLFPVVTAQMSSKRLNGAFAG
jgi:hypothetical protein